MSESAQECASTHLSNKPSLKMDVSEVGPNTAPFEQDPIENQLLEVFNLLMKQNCSSIFPF